MCGITGFLVDGVADQQYLEATVKDMADRMIHRGPDDSGVWADSGSGIALGFRRLSILDLSAEGHQPMPSACGRYIIVFNGEVYNFRKLRQELEVRGHAFRGHSDTEVILAAVREWGAEGAVRKFVGMFAFALWDRHERVLYLVRDRLGIKPLYFGLAGGVFVFASELKALRAHPDFVGEIDRDALALQMRYSCIPQPYSIYKGINKLTPGCILKVSATDVRKNWISVPRRYWSALDVYKKSISDPFKGNESEAIEELEALLSEAVEIRMVADVPLGAFLSGGIDSSIVVALMQAHTTRPVKTFTIGFNEDCYNEARHAKEVAAYLGTEHTELYVTPDEARSVITQLPRLFDEPFSDSSQIPTYLISVLARKQVTVSLSGDGGDETFGGYNRYLLSHLIWSKLMIMPRFARTFAAWGIRKVSVTAWDDIFNFSRPLLPSQLRMSLPGDKLHKLAELIVLDSPERLYERLVSHWTGTPGIVIGASELPTTFSETSFCGQLPEFQQWMMYMDLVGYLPEDILTKVDRTSMGVSLETRVPLLDHRIVEFASRLPLAMKIRGGRGKYLLREILCRYVPRGLVERPKMGFGVPIDQWLRGPLRTWAEDLLDMNKLKREGYFNPLAVRKLLEEHLSGKRNWQYYLWDVLMFQAWQSQWVS